MSAARRRGLLTRELSVAELEEGDSLELRSRSEVVVKTDNSYATVFKNLEELGKGKFGVVFKAKRKSDGEIYAAKFVRKSAASRKEVMREIEMMNLLHHKRLIQLYDAYETQQDMIVVMELVTGGELFEKVVEEDNLTERQVIRYMKQVLYGVQHMHRKNMVHLDLKPENILCLGGGQAGYEEIKLIDFGMTRVLTEGGDERVMGGTPEFIAPEVLKYDPVTVAADMWSIGVITYVLLSGLSPFMGDDDNETMENVSSGEYDFEDDDEIFENLSDELKLFIQDLLILDPEKRLTVEECLAHTWLRNRGSEKKLNTSNLKKFIARRRWQRTMNTIKAVSRLAGGLSLFGNKGTGAHGAGKGNFLALVKSQEAKEKSEEASLKKVEEEAAARKKKEAEEAAKKKKEAEEAAKKKKEAEEAAKKKKEAEEAAKKKKEAEEAAKKKKEAEEAAKKKMEAEEASKKKKEAKEAAKKKMEADEAAKKKKEAEEAAKKKIEAEEALKKKKEAEEAAKKKMEAKEALKKKKEAEEVAKKKEEVVKKEKEAEEAAKKKKEIEEAAKKKMEAEEAAKKKKETEEASKKKMEAEEAAKIKQETEEAAKKKKEADQAEQKKKEAKEAARKREEAEEVAKKEKEDDEAKTKDTDKEFSNDQSKATVESNSKREAAENLTSEATKSDVNGKEKKLKRMDSIRNVLKRKDSGKESKKKTESEKKTEKKQKEEQERKRKEQEKTEKKRTQEAEKKRKEEEKKLKKLSDEERKKLRDNERKKRQDERKNGESNNNGGDSEGENANPITISINGETESTKGSNKDNNNIKKPRVIKLTPGKQIQINGYTSAASAAFSETKELQKDAVVVGTGDDSSTPKNQSPQTTAREVQSGGVAGKASAFQSGDLYWNNGKTK